MQLGCALSIFAENNKQNRVHISLCAVFASDTKAYAKHKFTFLLFFFRESYLLEVDVDMKIIARLPSLKNCYFYHKDRHNIHAGHIN